MPKPTEAETTYPLRVAARMTGLSPELLRAWERRYAVVEPLRTEGGTRRYRASDLERLRRVKLAVDAGHRISQVAHLSAQELSRLLASTHEPAHDSLDSVLAALKKLDAAEAQRLLSLQLSALGATRFAREFALPLVHEIGSQWANDDLGIASEHLATGVLRSMLGSALTPGAAARVGPKILFATPTGERHELGLQMAALTAMGAGANPIYLGAELPVEDLLRAAAETQAAVMALSLVTIPTEQAERAIAALRGGLPDAVLLWIGGSGARDVAIPKAVERLATLEDLERRVALLTFA